LKAQIWEVDKGQPFYAVATGDELVSQTLKGRQFIVLLLGSFALIAMLLAGIGIYGLISFSTSQRTHEIGVRMALGAEARDVLRMILKEGIVLSLLGVGIGLVGAFALSRLLKGMLYEITPTDPLTFAAISLLLVFVAMLASYLPARRATKVDPSVALRYE
jgi:putative ABC transport system permease protein